MQGVIMAAIEVSKEVPTDPLAIPVVVPIPAAIPTSIEATQHEAQPHPSVLKLPAANPFAPTSEDASAIIQRMQVPTYETYGGGETNTYIRDLLQVAEAQDFVVETSGKSEPIINRVQRDLVEQDGMSLAQAAALVEKRLVVVGETETTTPYVEDTKIVTRSGEVLKPNSLTRELHQRLDRYLDPRLDLAPTDSGYSYLNLNDPTAMIPVQISGSLITKQGWASEADSYSKENHLPLRTTKSYVEGGNALFGRKADGSDYAIIGDHSALFTAFSLRDQKSELLNNPARSEKIAELKQQPKELLDAQIADAKERLGREAKGLLGYVTEGTAMKLLADIEIAKDVIAKDLQLPRSQVSFVEQPGFHIDMNLLPLTPGRVLVHTHQASAELLKEVLPTLVSGSAEQRLLQSMLEDAELKTKTLDPINERIIAQLERDGFDVVRSPGLYFGTLDAKEIHFNFHNAVPATVAESDKQYLITNGPGVPALEEAFENFLAKQGVEQVYWVGGPRAGEDVTTSASSKLLNNEAGLSCIQTARTAP